MLYLYRFKGTKKGGVMLHSIQNLIGFGLQATDGEIGRVKDFYLNRYDWKLRYLVVETGNWLFGRKVLISPAAIENIDLDSRNFVVNLSKDQVKHSPEVDTETTVSAEHEADLERYYSWPTNVGGGVGFTTTGMVGDVINPNVPFEERIAQEFHGENAPHQEHERSDEIKYVSFNDLLDYKIYATNSELGEVHDLLIDSQTWNIQFLVIETGSWYSNKQVLAAAQTIEKLDPVHSSIFLNQTSDDLRNSPHYDSSRLSDFEYENNLRQHYNMNR
jgi:uncharacterized protein YrrD